MLKQKQGRKLQNRQAYLEKFEARLNQYRADVLKMRAKASEATADAKIQYENALKTAAERQERAEKKLNEIRHSSDEAWTDLKQGFEQAWDDFSDAVKTASKRFN